MQYTGYAIAGNTQKLRIGAPCYGAIWLNVVPGFEYSRGRFTVLNPVIYQVGCIVTNFCTLSFGRVPQQQSGCWKCIANKPHLTACIVRLSVRNAYRKGQANCTIITFAIGCHKLHSCTISRLNVGRRGLRREQAVGVSLRGFYGIRVSYTLINAEVETNILPKPRSYWVAAPCETAALFRWAVNISAFALCTGILKQRCKAACIEHA